MAYSGTIGQTVVTVQNLIDEGARRSGKLAEELTSEQIISAKQNLFMLLSNLGNRGIQFWAVNKKIFGLKPAQYIYELPAGSIDVLNALYRKMSRPSYNSTGGYLNSAGGVTANAFDSDVDTILTQTSADGYVGINYGDDNPIYLGSIGILPGVSGSFHIVIETSTDGSTWTTLYDPGVVTWTDNTWIWYDIEPGQIVQYYRIRETGGNTLSLRELYFGNNSTEVPMASLNRDDYTSLPNKNFTANQPYQFWFNRTIPEPSLYLWPTPSNAFVQIVVWYSRNIMDVGALNGEIEIPQRWQLAIQLMLAHQMSMSIPGVDLGRIGYLEKMADKYLYDAEFEERENSPIYWAPNISVYTR